jgi:hypothetical protein
MYIYIYNIYIYACTYMSLYIISYNLYTYLPWPCLTTEGVQQENQFPVHTKPFCSQISNPKRLRT